MQVARSEAELDRAVARLRDLRGSVEFVPTMGALHAGHAALLRAARARRGAVVASIFVNPLQFGAGEDLARYPRDEPADLAFLAGEGCDLVWLPDVATMYPPSAATRIVVEGPAMSWEGDRRPGHFRGVATVCARLFGQVRPDRAYFGEKDWQQLQVVTRMAADLRLRLDIVPVPTVRDPDGLALSSRNRFLSPDERTRAPALHAALRSAAAAIAGGEAVAACLERGEAALRAAGLDPDYVALVDGATLAAVPNPSPGSRLIAACRLGAVRLLDNLAVA